MKARMRTVYVITMPNGTNWRGDCAAWAFAPWVGDATLTKIRVLWLGPAWPCGCGVPCGSRVHKTK